MRFAVGLLVSACVVLPLGLAAQETPAVAEAVPVVETAPAEEVVHAPKLVCDEPTYKFGELESSETVEHTFILRNEGDLDLEITRVKPACGCTAANLSEKIIHPGGEAQIRTRLSLRGRRGRQRKSITVESNDPKQPRLLLWIQLQGS